MGFLEKAKAAAMDLQQKADQAMNNAGLMGGTPGGPEAMGPMGTAPAALANERLLRDLGVLTYLNAVGRPGSAADYQRIMDELRRAEAAGALNLQLTPDVPGPGLPGGPPPPPGAVAAAASAPTAPPPPASGVGAPPPGPSAMGAPAPAEPGPVTDTGAQSTAQSTPERTEPVSGQDNPGQDQGATVQSEDLGGGGGQAPPPPPPSWA